MVADFLSSTTSSTGPCHYWGHDSVDLVPADQRETPAPARMASLNPLYFMVAVCVLSHGLDFLVYRLTIQTVVDALPVRTAVDPKMPTMLT